MKTPRWGLVRVVWAAVDGALVYASYILAMCLRFGAPPPVNLAAVLTALPWLTVTAVTSFAALRLYSSEQRDRQLVVCNAALGAVLTAVLAAALAFWTRAFSFPRGVILIALPIHLVLAVLWHREVLSTVARLRRPRRILIAGIDAEAVPILQKLWDSEKSGLRVVTACQPAAASDALHAGALEQVDAVLIGPNCSRDAREGVIRAAQGAGKEVYLLPGLEELYLSSAEVYRVDDLPLLRLRPLGLASWQLAVKRAIDLVLAVSALALLVLPMGVIAVAVVITSRGPALFRQTRIGRGGRPFTLLKFRTMVRDAEQNTGAVLCAPSDPRVTPHGRYLRALRVDEWPQLFNILRGNMSMVGPRPERPEFIAEFAASLPDYHLRHLVPPGITGLAQLAGHYGSLPGDKLRYDLSYIRKWSPLLDLNIILQTLGLFAAGGAEHGAVQADALPRELEGFLRASGVADWQGGVACGGDEGLKAKSVSGR